VSRHSPAVRPVRTDPSRRLRARSQRDAHAGRHRRARHRVDTHKDTHTAAVVVAATGAVLEQVTVLATPAGYQQLLKLARRQPGQRVWAIEGTGGYGAGLTRFLAAR